MSHIPAAAMPHAKPHEPQEAHDTPTPVAPPAKTDALPWGTLVAGGVLAIGGAVTAAWLLRGRDGSNHSASGRGAKSKRASKSRAKPQTKRARRAKAADVNDDS